MSLGRRRRGKRIEVITQTNATEEEFQTMRATERMMRFVREHSLVLIGGGLTLAWLALAFGLHPLPVGIKPQLRPNEMGDYLSGLAAPIAVIWLVIGMVMQAQALKVQQKELAHQIDEMRQLVGSSRDQVEVTRSSMVVSKAQLDLDLRREKRMNVPYLVFTIQQHAPTRRYSAVNLAGSFDYIRLVCLRFGVKAEFHWNIQSKSGQLSIHVPERLTPPVTLLPLHFIYRNDLGEVCILYYAMEGESGEVLPTDSEGWPR